MIGAPDYTAQGLDIGFTSCLKGVIVWRALELLVLIGRSIFEIVH
ncbi:MAG: hypothetical protein ACREL3_08525 [Gemmatimonadales bacterium]